MADADVLPIVDLKERLLETLTREQRVIVGAPTGSGKTTQLPQYVLDGHLPEGKKVVVLQPRRVAARAVARRVSQERGTVVGKEVGYQVRFDDQTSSETRLVFMTEGVLLRHFQDSPNLADIGVLILDEFHERNLYTDVALGLVKRLQAGARPDLKLIVMSATLDSDPLREYLEGDGNRPCPVLESEGRTYPVRIEYAARQSRDPVWQLAGEALAQILRNSDEGDILVFMPGMYEIQATARQFRDMRLGGDIEIQVLHGDLPPEQQDQVFVAPTQRRVIIATNVAESSITIPGIRYVIDSGLARIARFESETGLNSLQIEAISQASADQRSGRAGRTGPGVCYRLWTESGQRNRLPQTTPEVQRTELSEIVLQLHALGIEKAVDFDWLDAPDSEAVQLAEWLLWQLGAFEETPDRRVKLSGIGRQMLKLPMSPRYARMLIEGAKRGTFATTALCAALVSGRGLLMKVGAQDRGAQEAREAFSTDERSDFFTLLNAYREVERGGFRMAECRHFGINRQVALGVRQVHEQLLQQGRRLDPGKSGESAESGGDESEGVLKSLLAGFVDQLCQRESAGTLECRIVGGRRGTLARESVVQDHTLFVGTDIRTISSNRRGGLTLISLASAVEPGWLEDVYPGSVPNRIDHRYDRRQKRVECFETQAFGDLILQEARTSAWDPKKSGASLAAAWRSGELSLPQRDHRVEQFLLRVELLAETQPTLDLKPCDAEWEEAVIAGALAGERLAKEAQQKPLLPAYQKAFGEEYREWLDLLFPVRLDFLGEGERKLVYQRPKKKTSDRQIEVLMNVTITECFKLESHPTVGEGQVPVTLVMSIPKGKEVGRTVDWPRFKKQEYGRVKQVWKPKFPSVIWP